MTVVLLEPGLQALLLLPNSPVSRYVTLKAEAVAELARQNVQAQFRTRSGNLLQSIGVFPTETADGLDVEVGTDGAPYGKVLEEGSPGHEISANTSADLWSLTQDPNHPDPLYGRDLRSVNHPGTTARPWLKPALEQVIQGA